MKERDRQSLFVCLFIYIHINITMTHILPFILLFGNSLFQQKRSINWEADMSWSQQFVVLEIHELWISHRQYQMFINDEYDEFLSAHVIIKNLFIVIRTVSNTCVNA